MTGSTYVEFGESQRFSRRGPEQGQTGFDSAGTSGHLGIPGGSDNRGPINSMFDAQPTRSGRTVRAGKSSKSKLTIVLFVISLLMLGVAGFLLI